MKHLIAAKIASTLMPTVDLSVRLIEMPVGSSLSGPDDCPFVITKVAQDEMSLLASGRLRAGLTPENLAYAISQAHGPETVKHLLEAEVISA